MSGSSECEKYAELIDAYHDGELSAQERTQVEVHFSACAECRVALEIVTATVSKLNKLPKLNLSRDIVGSIDFAALAAVENDVAADLGRDPVAADSVTAASDSRNVGVGSSAEGLGSELMSAQMLHSAQGSEMLDAYHDGELSFEESLQVEQHLVDCAECSRKLKEIEFTVGQIKSIPKLELSHDLIGSMNLDCTPFLELLDAYLDNELEEHEKQQVSQHLEKCATCSSSLAQSARLVAGLKSMPRLSPSRDIVGGLNLGESKQPQFTLAASAAHPQLMQNNSENTDPVAADSKNKIVPIRRNPWIGLGAVAAAAVTLVFAINQRVIHVKEASVDSKQNQNSVQIAKSTAIANQGKESADPVEQYLGSSESSVNMAANTGGSESVQENTADNESTAGAARTFNDSRLIASSRPFSSNQTVQNGVSKNSQQRSIENEQRYTTETSDSRAITLNEVASLETDSGVADALGIATDEDGMYDIKI